MQSDKARLQKDLSIILDLPRNDRYSIPNVVKRYRKTLAENLQALIDDGEITESSTVKEVMEKLRS
jgi:hypothetical protein